MLDSFERVKCLYGDRINTNYLEHYFQDVEDFIFATHSNLPDVISSDVRLGSSLYASGETVDSVISEFFFDAVTLGRVKGEAKNNAFRYTSTPKLRDSLFQIMRQKMALDASAIIQQERYRLQLKSGTLDVDVPLLSSSAVGSVVSVWYKSPVVAEKNILQASSDLTLVTSNTDRNGSLSILVPTERSGMGALEFKRVSDVIEKQLDRLQRSGIEVIRAPSTDDLAAKTIDWWSSRIA
ncbi:hypothetical protein [Pseudomonas putida]|nr:hypothetical protein [Pseudomonas putida]